MNCRAFAGAVAGLMIALGLPGSAWAQTGSAVASAGPFVPAEVDIPSIGVAAVVAPVGTTMAAAPFLGGQMVPTFGVPPDGSSVGWWVDGPQVGAPGMAILLGHKQVGGGYAVFNRLNDLHSGDQVTVADATGSTRADFHITRVVPDIPKNDPEALRRVLFANAQDSQLALITCGDDFNQNYRASADNLVVFAARS